MINTTTTLTSENAEQIKKLQELLEKNKTPTPSNTANYSFGFIQCPTCGHCPTCGRGGGHYVSPCYPHYPVLWGNTTYTDNATGVLTNTELK